MIKTENIIGVWRLTKFVATATSDAEKRLYFGEHPKGRLIYTPGGFVQVAISALIRPNLSSPIDATEREKATAFDSFDAYSGKYTFDPQSGIVTHYTEIDRIPNYVDTAKQRRVVLENNLLVLDTIEPVPAFGKHWHLSLTWEKEE